MRKLHSPRSSLPRFTTCPSTSSSTATRADAGLAPNAALPVQESLAGLRERWHLLLPLLLMVYLLMSQYSLMLTGAMTLVVIIAVSWMRRATRMTPCDDLRGDRSRRARDGRGRNPVGHGRHHCRHAGADRHGAEHPAIGCWRWPAATLLLTLVGAMILTIIFGMGMPTAAAYLVSAILVAPALQEIGVPRPARTYVHLLFRDPLDGDPAGRARCLRRSRPERRQSLEFRLGCLPDRYSRIPYPLCIRRRSVGFCCRAASCTCERRHRNGRMSASPRYRRRPAAMLFGPLSGRRTRGAVLLRARC